MFSRGALAAFALILAEIVVFGLVVRALGAAFVVLGSLVLAGIGTLIVRRQIPELVNSGRTVLTSLGLGLGADGQPEQLSDRAMLAIAGVLLIVPGLITGAVGATLLLPPVRASVRRFSRNRFAHLVPSGFGVPFTVGGEAASRHRGTRVDVVDVDVVSEDVPRSAPPELD